MRRLLLVPDLNGIWDCVGKTVLKNGEGTDLDWSGEIRITQSWSRISISYKGTQSSSKSIAASIFHDKGIGYKLLYQYQNIPLPDQQNIRIHSGTTELLIEEGCKKAEGHYFTDHNRTTVGNIKLKKKGEIK